LSSLGFSYLFASLSSSKDSESEQTIQNIQETR